MEEIKIDKGVPIPERTGRPKSKYGRTVESMEAGDSVFCDTEIEMERYRQAGLHRGFKMKRAKVDGGWRVWVIERKAKATVIPLAPRKSG